MTVVVIERALVTPVGARTTNSGDNAGTREHDSSTVAHDAALDADRKEPIDPATHLGATPAASTSDEKPTG